MSSRLIRRGPCPPAEISFRSGARLRDGDDFPLHARWLLIAIVLAACLIPARARAANPTSPNPPAGAGKNTVTPPGPADRSANHSANQGTQPAGAAAVPPGGAPAKSGGPRVAIIELALEGDGAAPALAMQLQDGFVLGLLRAGIDVIDSADVEKRLAGSPELKGCDSSPCLKRAGELLGARYALRVKVALTGNSYTMTTRLFSTQGAAPAALPVATLSRSCIVCTVGEARDAMIKLADGMRARIETETAAVAPPPTSVDTGGSKVGALTALAAGVVAVALGAAVISSAGAADKSQAALGGTLVGAGITTSAVALFLTLRSPDPEAAKKTALVPGFWRF